MHTKVSIKLFYLPKFEVLTWRWRGTFCSLIKFRAPKGNLSLGLCYLNKLYMINDLKITRPSFLLNSEDLRAVWAQLQGYLEVMICWIWYRSIQFQSARCDGYEDCPDGEDERDCTRCKNNKEGFYCKTSKRCLTSMRRCDGVEDCPGGADEERCTCKGFKFFFIF